MMSRRGMLGSASLALALGPAVARAAKPLPPRVAVRTSSPSRAVLGPLAEYAAAELAAWGFPGMTLAVRADDGLDATLTFGWADTDKHMPVDPAMLFQIGSISKSVVALALYRLHEMGKLDLDAPAVRAVPGLPIPADITLARMLDHTSGLPNDAPLFPHANGDRLWAEPPGKFYYSNTAFDLLGHVVAEASGQPFDRAIRALVLTPLGMNASEPVIRTRDRVRYPQAYIPFRPDQGYFPLAALAPYPWLDTDIAAGSVASTPGDMARYVAFLSALGQGRGAPLMSDALARRFVTTTTDAEEFGPKGRYSSGIATIEIDGRTLLQHTGGMIGFSSSITVDPGVGGAFASVNIGGTSYRPRPVTRYACQLLLAAKEGRPLPPVPEVKLLDPVKEPANFAGRYLAATGDAIEVRADGASLWVEADATAARLTNRGFTDHPRLYRHQLDFQGEGAKTALWWGGTLYGRGAAAPTPPVTARVAALAGLYLSNDPWVGGASIVARGDALVVEGLGEIRPAADGSWRAADPEAANERMWFDAMLGGKAQRFSFSGDEMLRFAEEG